MPDAVDTTGPEPRDPVEDLLGSCLASDRPDAALRAACETHPAHAAALRARYDALVRMGMVPEPDLLADERRVGRFTLQERLGGGGMGIVWRATEAPLGREVALKLVRSEHLGLENARERFLREIAAAAALSHPGIVPILGYGDADGTPWYSMPVVAGRSLAEILAAIRGQAREPRSEDLRSEQPNWAFACCAFAAQVAHALAHAHGRGIVHRDVKPSNVMLDDEGHALLIDFGLAQVEGTASMTRTGVQPGSLAYMSPEQVRGESVDARTDVWSLGVVLYEALTLRQPFAADTEAATRANILAAKPPQPSTSGTRVPWDVATVLAKAMAPERQLRYAGAAEFAADLEAILAHRPIAARRAGPWLRTTRFVRRRPTLATALALGVLVAILLPTTLLVQERHARTVIEREANTSRRVVALMTELFREVEPERARGATVPARVVLDRGARLVREGLGDEPAVKVALLETLGTVYLNLGLLKDAGALLDEMKQVRAPLLERDPALRQRTDEPLARLAMARGDAAEAERLWRSVATSLAAAPDGDLVPLATAKLQLAHAIWRQDRLDEAGQLLTDTIATLRERLPRDDLHLAEALLTKALFLHERFDRTEAEPLFAEALATLRARLPADHPRVLSAQVSAAANHEALGRFAEAETELRDVIAIATTVFDANHPQLAMARELLALVLMETSRVAEARQQIDLALAAYRSIHSPPHAVLARARSLDGSIAFEQGTLAAAESALGEALAMYEALFPDGNLDRATALSAACRLYLALGRLDAAETAGRASLAMAEKHGQRDRSSRALAHAHLAYVLALRANLAPAKEHIDTAVELIAQRTEPTTRALVLSYAAEIRCIEGDGTSGERLAKDAIVAWERVGSGNGRGWALTTLGWALDLQQRNAEAERVLRDALVLREQHHGENHPYVSITLTALGTSLARQAKYAEAEVVLRRAVDIRLAQHDPADLNLGRPLINLAILLQRQGKDHDAILRLRDCVKLLHGRIGRGHAEGNGVVLLAIKLLQKPEGAELREIATPLREIAAAVYAPDSATLAQLEGLLAR